METAVRFKSTDEYIKSFGAPQKQLLKDLREAIRSAAPQAEELISYNMPALKYNGVLVYYAAYAKHIGFYPTASGIANFTAELKIYQTSKGAVQFPVDKPIPVALVKKIVKFRMAENEAKKKAKKK